MARAAKGDGTLFKSADGRWRGYVTLPNGKRKYFSGATKAEAAVNRKKLIQQRDSTGLATGKGYTVGVWLDRWIQTKAQADHAPKTTASYRQVLNRYITSGLKAKPLNKVTIEAIEDEYQHWADHGLAGSTIHQIHSLLSAAFKSAVMRGHMPFNPAALIENKPRAQHAEPTSLSFADLHAIELGLEGDRMKLRWMLALTLGLRPSEIRGLEWKHLDIENATLQIEQQVQRINKQFVIRPLTKTKAGRRVIPVPAFIMEMFKEHRLAQLREFDPILMWSPDREAHSWVFTSRRTPGQPISPNSEATNWAALLARVGIPHTRPYTTRHTAASMLIAHGVDPVTVAEILGHTDPSFTMRTYSHAIEERKRQAADVLDGAFGERKSGTLSGTL